MREITLDLETRNFFHDVGSNDPADLDLSVVCIHDSADGGYKSFFEDGLRGLWPILEQADALVTWNGDHFDIPLLNKYYPGDLSKLKSIDLMKALQRAIGRRIKLDNAGEATLGRNKTAAGAEALLWWQNGEIGKLVEYCTEDVRLTRDLYDYACRNGRLKYKELGTVKEALLDTADWRLPASAAMTHTLPF